MSHVAARRTALCRCASALVIAALLGALPARLSGPLMGPTPAVADDSDGGGQAGKGNGDSGEGGGSGGDKSEGGGRGGKGDTGKGPGDGGLRGGDGHPDHDGDRPGHTDRMRGVGDAPTGDGAISPVGGASPEGGRGPDPSRPPSSTVPPTTPGVTPRAQPTGIEAIQRKGDYLTRQEEETLIHEKWP